ncbi:MAG: prepilin peptidase [Lachnospiraceae bacterium]|nr:prepilin peptidase [Lachnospiraceae bacterium]
MEYAVIIYPLVFLYGVLVGSFLNVCIYRIPKHESIVTVPSHCMSCGYGLKWYDLVPVFSWLCLRGKCRKCKAPISAQYPIIEALNGGLWLLIIFLRGLNVEGVLYCLLASALVVLSMIDFATYEIPFGINVFIGVLGLVRLCTDLKQWYLYALGFCLVSGIFWIVLAATKGRGMGGGDVKLMAAAGLLLGAPKVFLAMLIGCLLAVIVHPLRMKLSGEGHRLAFGPYLAAGILVSALAGEPVIAWYVGLF